MAMNQPNFQEETVNSLSNIFVTGTTGGANLENAKLCLDVDGGY